MSESGDYIPAPHWKGYDFASKKREYMDVVDRSYKDAVSVGVIAADLVPEGLKTECETPLVIACDVTGSMGEWPAVIFSKLPYLEHEAGEYLGDDVEISFAAVGDGPSHDKYPLQVRPFCKGADLKTSLEKLVHEKGGGGSSEESYDLAALYYARLCEMTGAIRKPIFIFIGDEGVYNFINADDAKRWTRVDMKQKASPEAVFAELKEKFNVYIIRKPYNCDSNNRSEADKRIQSQWEGLLGPDHVVSLPDPARVVDVIFGILGKETNKLEYFEKELKDRQLKDKDGKAKIDVVLKSLHTIHGGAVAKASVKKLPPPKHAKSITRKGKDEKSKKSISLLDDED